MQVVTTGVGGATEQKRALALVFEVRLDRIKAHERREGDRISPIALEGLHRVLGRRAADVAALGVQNHRHPRRHLAHVGHQPLELTLGAVRGKVGNLRFEGDHQIGCGLHNGSAKIKNAAGIAAQRAREAGRLWVQSHAHHGLVAALSCAQPVKKAHRAIVRSRPVARRSVAHSMASDQGPAVAAAA